MKEQVDQNHDNCGKDCVWPTFHSNKTKILSGYLHKDVVISSDRGETPYFSRAAQKQTKEARKQTVLEDVSSKFQHFCQQLYDGLGHVYDADDIKCIEATRKVADLSTLALKLKRRSPALISALESKSFVENAQKLDRNLKQITKETMRTQYRTFLDRLAELTNHYKESELKETDSKDLIKLFLSKQKLYSNIECIMQAISVACIKVSVESVAESMISKYTNHATKFRSLNEQTAEDEMMVAYNGPELNECDGILSEALDKYFNGKPWHFIVKKDDIFKKRQSKTITRIFKRKSKLPFLKYIFNLYSILYYQNFWQFFFLLFAF